MHLRKSKSIVLLKMISFLLIIVISIMCPCFSVTALDTDIRECSHGYNTYYDHVLNGGVGDYGSARRYYWINSNLGSDYALLVQQAMENWTYTTDQYPYCTTSISLRETSSKSESTFEFHQGNLEDTTLGQTTFFVYQEQRSPYNSNWGWAKITLDKSFMQSVLSEYHQLGTITHEAGHAMGLAHTLETNRIMCQYGSGKLLYKPHRVDCQTINHLYD